MHFSNICWCYGQSTGTENENSSDLNACRVGPPGFAPPHQLQHCRKVFRGVYMRGLHSRRPFPKESRTCQAQMDSCACHLFLTPLVLSMVVYHAWLVQGWHGPVPAESNAQGPTTIRGPAWPGQPLNLWYQSRNALSEGQAGYPMEPHDWPLLLGHLQPGTTKRATFILWGSQVVQICNMNFHSPLLETSRVTILNMDHYGIPIKKLNQKGLFHIGMRNVSLIERCCAVLALRHPCCP